MTTGSSQRCRTSITSSPARRGMWLASRCGWKNGGRTVSIRAPSSSTIRRRVARVSFTGDRSYEISVASSQAPALWRAMNEVAKTVDGGLMGSEALLLLRAEKGYIIAGKDTDGTSMPHDLGVTGPRDKRKSE